MKPSNRLLNIEKSIKKYNPNYYTNFVTVDGFSRPLLLVAIKGASRKIKIYDDMRGLDNVAIIRYSMNGDRLFISELEVSFDYQRHGIGKMLLELAIAHGDELGAKSMFCHAFPTAQIKGVSQYGYKAEVDALTKFYQSAGCQIKRLADNSTKMFVQTWTNGEKIDNAKLNIQILAQSITEHESSIKGNSYLPEKDIETTKLF